MRYGIDLHVATDDEITAGHRAGIIRIAGASIYFGDALYDKQEAQLVQLKEIVQVQINAIIAEKIQAGQEPLPANAPAVELAAPWIAPQPADYAGAPLKHEEGISAAPEGEPIVAHAPGSELAESIRASEAQWIQGRADGREPIDFIPAPPPRILGGVFDHKEGCRAPDYGPCTCGLTGIASAAPPLEGQPVEVEASPADVVVAREGLEEDVPF